MKKIFLIFPDEIGTINPEVYGHFAEHIGGVIYDGIWVGKDSKVPNINGFRKDLVEAFKKLDPPVIRWPGGCFAETYNWRDGIGKNRPTTLGWWSSSDFRYESNEMGTHEFLDFCELVGAKPYIAANISSIPPLEMRNYFDYCMSPRGSTSLAGEREKNGRPEPWNIPYWGIGNETWIGGGNMEPDEYAHEYRKYAVIAGNVFGDYKLIACGPNDCDVYWTRKFMEVFERSEKKMHGFSLHFYCMNLDKNAVDFTKDEWYQQMKQANNMDAIIKKHWGLIQGFNMEQHAKLVIDEWGCWHQGGSGPSKGYNLFEQQSTVRDAVVAAITLNIFNNNCEKIMMANAAQLVNNLHCLFLAGGENFILTPTYHVFDMYKGHMGATAIKAIAQTDTLECRFGENDIRTVESLSVSASYKDDDVLITIANLSADHEAVISLESVGEILDPNAEFTILTHEDFRAHNTFEFPDMVMPETKSVNISRPITLPPASASRIKAKMLRPL